MGCKIRDFAYGYSAVLFIMPPWTTKRTEEEETERIWALCNVALSLSCIVVFWPATAHGWMSDL
jgi:hypothetical protein